MYEFPLDRVAVRVSLCAHRRGRITSRGPTQNQRSTGISACVVRLLPLLRCHLGLAYRAALVNLTANLPLHLTKSQRRLVYAQTCLYVG